MEFSHKIRNLLIVSVGIIVLALAANEGTRNLSTPATPLHRVPYPFVPTDIDPRALDLNQVVAPIASTSVPIKAPTQAAPRPIVSAEAYLTLNLDTGERYAERNPNKVFPIASLSKLITSIVALHSMLPDHEITITQPMLDAYGDAGHLVLGETYTLSELLYPLLLESSNDAAEAIAQTYGYDAFIEQMNSFAAGLGMSSTAFKDASGLSPGNYSNARDLALLARYIYANEKPLLELTRQTSYSVATTTAHGSHTWHTINPFPLDPHFMGGKTGRTTEAKESMMSFFRHIQNGITYPVVVIVLRSDFSVREVDTSYLFSQAIQKIMNK